MNLTSILVFLQMVVALLSTPNLPADLQAKASDLASQGIEMAQEAIMQYKPVASGAAPVNDYVASPVQPSPAPQIAATSTVYVPQKQDTCVLQMAYWFDDFHKNNYVSPFWMYNNEDYGASSTMVLWGGRITGDKKVNYDQFQLQKGGQLAVYDLYKARVGNAVCYAFWENEELGKSYTPSVGEHTVSNPPDWATGVSY